ncbi:MAG TPA: amidohydrolase family protein [Longimicrobiales bacterium]|nr:amidohydrolase family protein [Longimicrobiales bacterium]
MFKLLCVIAPLLASQTNYRGDVHISPETRHIRASWTITFPADSTTRDSVAFLLNPGLKVSKLTGPLVRSFVDTTTTNRILIVRFKRFLKVGETTAIHLAYEGEPTFGSDHINGISENWIELGLDSFWHPVFADFSKRIIGQWNVHLPAGWKAVASGTTTTRNNVVTFRNTTPLIDLAFGASRSLKNAAGTAASVFHVGADSATVTRILKTAGSCAMYLNTRFGEKEKLPPAKIVLAPREGPGYARQNYIVITDAARMDDVALSRFVCHEFSHFWSSNAVSSGPENWLNESFAEFAAGRYVRDQFGADEYAKVLAQWREALNDSAPVWTAELTRRPGARIAYRKAPALLDALERRIGNEKMNDFLRRYMTERVGRTVHLLALLDSADASWFRVRLADHLAPDVKVIRRVSVVDVVTGTIAANRAVVVRGDRIADIVIDETRDNEFSQYKQIEGRGRFLIPGLWDMHVHASFEDAPAFLREGVTGVRDMGGSIAELTRWRRDTTMHPRIVFSGPRLTGGARNQTETWWVIKTPEEGRAAVDSLKRASVDFIKVHDNLELDVFNAIVAEAQRLNLPVAGHVPAAVGPIAAARGMKSIEHLEFLPKNSETSLDSVFLILGNRKVWLTPTIGMFRVYVSPTEYEALHQRFSRLLPQLKAARIQFLAGTDADGGRIPDGTTLKDELQLLVKAGFTPLEALQTATINPARFLSLQDTMGSIQIGKVADLVLLEANPLENIEALKRVVAVMISGKQVPLQ